MRVTELWTYPIKSLRGHRVDTAKLDRRGLEGDRRWMLVDGNGRFVTQRERPELTLFRASLQETTIRIARGEDAFELPRRVDTGERIEVSVWGHQGPAIVHAEASRWLSERLRFACRVVFMPDDVERPVNPARSRPGDLVSFADGYPLLLVSEASLDALNARLPSPVAMERFRPNVVVEGAAPHEEDAWMRLKLGDVPLRGVKPCERCAITTIDPDTGTRGKEPLQTLATYRRTEAGVLFGMNVIHDREGTLRVGDPVEVLERRL